MKIRQIESFSNRQVCIVRVTSDDGATGYGQTAPFEADLTQIILHRQVAPLALGREDDDFSLADSLIASLHKFSGTYVCRAAAGIDTALWDLKGRRTGRSVASLLGEPREKIGMYYSSMVRDWPVEKEAERMRQLRDERGYRAFKLHVGVWNSEGTDYWPGRTEAMLEAAAAVLGDQDELYVDPNGAFGHDWSVRLLPLMKSCGVRILEEPLPFWKIRETAALRQAMAGSDILMAGGEQDYNPNAWDLILDLPMADIIQPDIGYIGGFTRALDVAKRAAARGIYTTPHTSNRSMLLPFGLHLMAAIEKPWPYLEHGVEEDLWTEELMTEPLAVTNGFISVPQGPGWGVEISPDWMKKACHMITK